jgi:membrane protein YqaA with SNARE-associated domain
MSFDLSALFADCGLLGVALSAFTSATILPGTSEAAVLAYQVLRPEQTVSLLAVASVANTAGSMCSYLIGRLIPQRRQIPERASNWLERFGPLAMALCWVPLAGDAIPIAAGWMRLPAWSCTICCALGKTLRYAFILGICRIFL